jgi:UDP-glucose 4-epimerase
MKILVTGGAGYIGSHMVKLLLEQGHDVVTLDNFSTGYRSAVLGGEVIEGNVGDRALLDNVFETHSPDAVVHCAASVDPAEALRAPARCYESNVVNSQTLLDAMVAHDVPSCIFTSSADVFGDPVRLPIDELHPLRPAHALGWSKMIVERMLQDYWRAYGLRSVALRCFNVTGADPDAQLGERREPAASLPALVLQAASGRLDRVRIFGDDYDTVDGTCVRDFVHVWDVCEAHLLALERLQSPQREPRVYNVCSGIGTSVQQAIACGEAVSGQRIARERCRRRAGDIASLVGEPALIRAELGWMPKRSDLETLMHDAWRWEVKLGGVPAPVPGMRRYG